MRTARALFVVALLFALAVPCAAGIHYQAVTKTEASGRSTNIEVEGWVSGGSAKVVFKESGNPMFEEGAYLLTKDGGKTLYLVNPKEKTYAVWDLEAMMGMVGGIMQGMGPLLKIEFSEPKVENLGTSDGGAILGLPTRRSRSKTSYSMKVKVLGMGQSTDVVNEQDVWATTALTDLGLGIWLRSDPPKTGNAQFDKLIAAGAGKIEGFPLKTVTVSTSTQKGRSTTSRSTMEVTLLDAKVSVPAANFEIPVGYEETQMMVPGQPERR